MPRDLDRSLVVSLALLCTPMAAATQQDAGEPWRSELVPAERLLRPRARIDWTLRGPVFGFGPDIGSYDRNEPRGEFGLRSSWGIEFDSAPYGDEPPGFAFPANDAVFWSLFDQEEGAHTAEMRPAELPGMLRLVGDAAFRESRKSMIPALVAGFVPRVRYALYLVRWGEEDAPSGVIPAAAAEKLRARVEEEKGLRVSYESHDLVRAATDLSVGRLSPRKLLADYNVEIAQDAAAGDPVVWPVRSGLEARLCFEPVPESEDLVVALSVLSSRADGPVRVFAHGTPKIGPIESMPAASSEVQLAVRLPAAAALALDVSRDASERELLLLFAQREDPPPKLSWRAGDREIRILPYGWLGRLELFRYWPSDVPSDKEPRPRPSPSFLSEDPVRALQDELDPDAERFRTVRLVDGHTELDGPAEAVATLARLQLERLTPWYRHRELRIQLQEEHGADWTDIGGPLLLSLMPGRVSHARRGRSVSFVGDYDVEVATAVVIADPNIHGDFEGIVALARPNGTEPGAGFELRFLERVRQTWKELDAPGPGLGQLRLPIALEQRSKESWSLEPGEERVLGDALARPVVKGEKAPRRRWVLRMGR